MKKILYYIAISLITISAVTYLLNISLFDHNLRILFGIINLLSLFYVALYPKYIRDNRE